MFLIKIVKEHFELVQKGAYLPENITCKNCKNESNHWVFHEAVSRGIRYIENKMVYCAMITVLRWSCKHCRKTFRHLPPFLKPYKRFITPVITEISSKIILSTKHKTYEKSVTNSPPNQTKIVYADGSGSRLSASSCWRWISCMSEIFLHLLNGAPCAATESSIAKSEADTHMFSAFQANSTERFIELHNARKLHLSEKFNFD